MRESSSCDREFFYQRQSSQESQCYSYHRIYSIRDQRDISLNANYIVVLKNPRDRAQIRYLARQVYLDDPKFLEEAYYDANLISGVFVARSETINPRRVSISNMYFSRGYDSLCLHAA